MLRCDQIRGCLFLLRVGVSIRTHATEILTTGDDGRCLRWTFSKGETDPFTITRSSFLIVVRDACLRLRLRVG